MSQERKEAAAPVVSTGGLVDELLALAGGVNGLLNSLEDVEQSIHEAKADGEPVSEAANDVVAVLDQVRPHLDEALGIVLEKLPGVMGASTPEPVEEPLPEEDEELIEELPEADVEE